MRENSMEMEDPIYKGYKDVLDSKSSDETLVSYRKLINHLKSCVLFNLVIRIHQINKCELD